MTFLLLVAVLASCGAVTARAQAEPGVLRIGFADDAAMIAYPGSAQVAVQAGFSYARIYLSWADVARSRPADPRNPADPAYDWSEVDRTLAPYAGTGLEIMAQLWRTPAWANGGHDQTWYAQDPADFGDFVYAAARRYPQIQWWLPVNEPNRSDYVQPATIPAYEPMLRAAFAAVKQANPAAQVVGGSTSRDLEPDRNAWDWASTLAADGAPMDAYAVHPYPNWTQPIAERGDQRLDIWDLPSLQSTVRVPVMAMEYGWSTSVVSEDDQAQWLSDAIRVARCTRGLTRFTLWGFHDHPGAGTADSEQWGKFGLLRQDGSPKPALVAVETAMHEPLDCAAVAVAAGAPEGWLPAAEASVVAGVPGVPPPPLPPPAPPVVQPSWVPVLPPLTAANAANDQPRGMGVRGPPAPRAAAPAAPASGQPVIVAVRRSGIAWWAVVRAGRPMGVGGRVDRLLPTGRARLVRGLAAQPVARGVHRVRLGVLRAGRYRIALRCRPAGAAAVMLRRAFRAPPRAGTR